MQVKWPNDVLVDGKKVCGVLLEGSLDSDRVLWAIAGIGLNVNSAPSAMLRGLRPEQRSDWQGQAASTLSDVSTWATKCPGLLCWRDCCAL